MDQTIPIYGITISKLFQNPDLTSDYCYSYDKKTFKSIQKRNGNPRKKAIMKPKILHAAPINPNITRMMGGDLQKVKKWQSEIDKYVDCLNDMGYESPAVLYSTDRNWQTHQIKSTSWRFPKNSKQRYDIDQCLKFLREA